MISSLVLDWAGTLADDITVTLAATNDTLARFGGRAVDLETYRRDFRIPVEGFYAPRLPGVPIADVDAEFFRRYAQHVGDAPLFEGTHALLHGCALRGIKLFILSTVPTEILAATLAARGLGSVFTGIFGGASDKRGVLPRILAEHGLIRDETLYVGDTLHDLEAARIAGVRSGAALYGYTSRERLVAASPDYAFGSMRDVVNALDREWMYQSQKVVIPTVGGIVLHPDGRILVVRTRKWSDTFGIPGGKIEYGETMLAAYEREIREETGLEVRNSTMLMIQDCIESPEFLQKRHFLLINYVSHAVDPTTLKPNYELEEARWVTTDEAQSLRLNQPTRIALREATDRGLLRRPT